MEKNEIYKWFAIGLVLVFGIEMIAMGVLNQNNRATPDTTGQAATGQTIAGAVSDNVTVVRYEPYLIVTGNASAIDAVKQMLIDNGAATYAVPNQESVIVNLKDSKYAVASAAAFERANASVLATAVITTSTKLKVVGSGVTTTVDGSSFRMQIRPIYDEGSVASATFQATVQDGQLVSLSNFMILPTVVSGVRANATVVSFSQTGYAVEVAWQNRSAAKPIVAAEGASYKEKSYIRIKSGAASAQLEAIKVYPFVTATQDGLVSVKNDFADAETAYADLSLMKLEPTFPASLAYFGNQSDNSSAASLAAKLKSAGIDARLISQTRVNLQLPSELEKDGRKYSVGENEIAISSQNFTEGAASMGVLVDFETAGSRVSKIISVRQDG